jgi:hypothetical protein
VRARHILLGYQLTADDGDRARIEAEGIRALIDGGAAVDSLQQIYLGGDSLASEVIELGRNQLPPPYVSALDALDEGETAVIETPTGHNVVISRGIAGGGEVGYEEIAPRLRLQIEQQRAEAAFVERLKDEVYMDVRVKPEDVLDTT